MVPAHAVVVTLKADSFVCVFEALIAKKEAIMDQQAAGSGRWWEAVTLLLAINSVVFGFLFGSHIFWAILSGGYREFCSSSVSESETITRVRRQH